MTICCKHDLCEIDDHSTCIKCGHIGSIVLDTMVQSFCESNNFHYTCKIYTHEQRFLKLLNLIQGNARFCDIPNNCLKIIDKYKHVIQTPEDIHNIIKKQNLKCYDYIPTLTILFLDYILPKISDSK